MSTIVYPRSTNIYLLSDKFNFNAAEEALIEKAKKCFFEQPTDCSDGMLYFNKDCSLCFYAYRERLHPDFYDNTTFWNVGLFKCKFMRALEKVSLSINTTSQYRFVYFEEPTNSKYQSTSVYRFRAKEMVSVYTNEDGKSIEIPQEFKYKKQVTSFLKTLNKTLSASDKFTI